MINNINRFSTTQWGFTLVEIMISLTLGLVISSAVVQVMSSNSMSEKLNRALGSSQESGRYIISRMRTELLMVGLYDSLNPALSNDVDIVEEASFVRNHPIPIAGDFSNRMLLGSSQGANGASDTLVVSLQGHKDCRGYTLAYNTGEEFFVVNEYFVIDSKLKCRGFDGRFLRGQKAAQGHNRHAAYTILDGVLSFQVSYGIADPNKNKGEALTTKYIDASGLRAAYDANQQVVSLRIVLVVKGEGDISLDQKLTFKLLNEDPISAPDKGLYKAFETTVLLRNMKNFVRRRA